MTAKSLTAINGLKVGDFVRVDIGGRAWDTIVLKVYRAHRVREGHRSGRMIQVPAGTVVGLTSDGYSYVGYGATDCRKIDPSESTVSEQARAIFTRNQTELADR